MRRTPTARKPWMKDLRSFRFTRDGTMTTETARGWKTPFGFGALDHEQQRRAYECAMQELRERGPDTPLIYNPDTRRDQAA